MLKSEESDNALIQIKKVGKPSKKGKSKLACGGTVAETPVRSGQNYNLGKITSNIEIEKGTYEQENKQFPDSFSSVFTDALDALISPIKVDHIFGS